MVEPTQALQPTAEAPQLTAEAPQLTAEAVSCLYGVGCSYESPIHNHTDCFSWRGGNTNPCAGTRANATIPTALAGSMDTQSWRGAHKTDDASTTADS